MGRWAAYVHKDKRFYHLGYFTDATDAARARDTKAVELFGTRAAMNFPDPARLGYVFQGDGGVRVPLTQGEYAIIDADDLDRVIQYRWACFPVQKVKYAVAQIQVEDDKPRRMTLHRFILTIDAPEVDHIDGDGLNCRKANLRPAERHQNAANLRVNSRNTSGYKGVSYARQSGKWYASLQHNGKTSNLGYYATAEEAARAYDEAARRAFGEFARVNLTA